MRKIHVSHASVKVSKNNKLKNSENSQKEILKTFIFGCVEIDVELHKSQLCIR